MRRSFALILAMISFVSALANTRYKYKFNSTPISEALSIIAEEHPSVNLNFIYNELENYKTSANIDTDDLTQAIRHIIGLNPITLSSRGNVVYVEALQHGKYCFTGNLISTDHTPVAAATVLVLTPKDSTVITYGITDAAGRFSIPCDKHDVILKLSCIGYKTTYMNAGAGNFALGTILMPILPKNLQQFTIEGSSQKVIQNGVMYIPDKKVKKASIDGRSLLFHMQIPQLKISPDGNSIKTIGGETVNTFIDYVKTESNDLQALRPEDVVRVEVLDYPVDSRFMGATHVVNFIMRKYEWGGYSKLTLSGQTLNNDLFKGGVYQKFKYKNLTLDASVSACGERSTKNLSFNKEIYRNFNYLGSHYDQVSRLSSSTGYSSRENNQEAAVRATYSTKKTSLIHSLSFSRNGTPESKTDQSVRFSNENFPSTEAVRDYPGQNTSLRLTGNYQFSLPKGYSIITVLWYQYSSNKQNSSYRLGNLSPIINLNREKVHEPNLTAFFSKRLDHNNTLRLMISSYLNYFNTDYLGSYNGTEKLLSSESMVFTEYLQNWGRKFNIYVRVGLSYVLGRLNGKTMLAEYNPRLGLSLNYTFNSKNSLSFQGWLANSSPRPYTANTALVKQNELLWYEGNPNLKNIYGPLLGLSYNYIPNNRFSIAASLNYNLYNHLPIYQYYVKEGTDGIIRTYTDNNNDHELKASLRGTLRLLNNSLTLSATADVSHQKNSGYHSNHLTTWTGSNFILNYYYKNTSLTLYYVLPQKNILSTGGLKENVESTYGVIATYGIKNFKAEASFRNWFNNGKSHTTYDSPYFASSGWQWRSQLARSVYLSLSYLLPYGKKIKENSDLRNEAIKNSAILE